jgi:hypothetical protein
MAYARYQMVVNKKTGAHGEVLHHFGHGVYRVRYPVHKDPDRDYDIIIEKYTDLKPISLEDSLSKLYDGYAHGKGEWQVPVDARVREEA